MRSQCIKLVAPLRITEVKSGLLEWYVVLWKSEWFEVLRDDGGSHAGSSFNKAFHDRDLGEELEVIFEEQVFGSVLDMQVLTYLKVILNCIFFFSKFQLPERFRLNLTPMLPSRHFSWSPSTRLPVSCR